MSEKLKSNTEFRGTEQETTTSSQGTYDYAYPPADKNQYKLTQEEDMILDEHELAITEQISQSAFIDERHFIERSNNYNLFFSPNNAGDVWRTHNAYKRFELIRPELANALRTSIKDEQDKIDQGLISPLNKTVFVDNAATFHEAYRVMSALVDASDKDVIRQNEDTGIVFFNSYFLCT